MKEDNEMKIEFKAVLILILNLLEHGDVQRAIDTIKQILKQE